MIELFWRVHPKLYAWSGGLIGGKLMGMPVLLLTTTGRKSRQPRTTALMYLPHGKDMVVIASVLGEPRHPYWHLNLMANPDASVRVGRKKVAVRAREAAGDEREALWRSLIQKTPDYDEYQARTSRRIPVVVLEPR